MTHRKEVLEEAAKISKSFSDIARHLGRKPVGGTISNISRACKRLGIDTSHFMGQGHNKGKVAQNKKRPDQILVLDDSKLPPRSKRVQLKYALLEIGIEYKCDVCELTEWNGEELTLDIDHINGKYWDSRRENLRFICPNCHRQTPTWGRGGMADTSALGADA